MHIHIFNSSRRGVILIVINHGLTPEFIYKKKLSEKKDRPRLELLMWLKIAFSKIVRVWIVLLIYFLYILFNRDILWGMNLVLLPFGGIHPVLYKNSIIIIIKYMKKHWKLKVCLNQFLFYEPFSLNEIYSLIIKYFKN